MAVFLAPLHAAVWHQARRFRSLAWIALLLQTLYLSLQISYNGVFGNVLSLTLAAALWRESSEIARLGGLRASPWIASALFPWPWFLWWIRSERVRISWHAAWLLVPCLALAIVSASIHPSIWKPFGRKHVLARLGVAGFEATRFLDQARQHPLALGPSSPPNPGTVHPNILVLQIESLDARMPFLDWNGAPVMPRLRAWCDSGAFYPFARAYHGVGGSSESDFASIFSIVPAPDVAPFLATFPHDHSLPRLLAPNGYRSAFVHGNMAEFWGRGEVYRDAGFDALLFEDSFPFPRLEGYWWGRPDGQTYQTALRWIRSDSTRAWYMHLVTMTSHEPFKLFQTLGVDKGYPQTPLGDLLTSFRYVDSTVGLFLDSVRADGRTWVLLFGDHPPPAGFTPGFTSSVVPQRGRPHEFVPLLILPPPGRAPIHLDSLLVASTLDILPTVAGLTGTRDSIRSYGMDLLAPSMPARPPALIDPVTGARMDRTHLRAMVESFSRSPAALHDDPALHQGTWRDRPRTPGRSAP